jgi:hypothetical protein
MRYLCVGKKERKKDDLEEEDTGADGGCDDRPAGHEEVAGVVADHVLQGLTEPPKISFC